jgi:hypothetical protein
MSKEEKVRDQKRNIQAHEVREGLFKEGILLGGVTLCYEKRRSTWKEK